MKVIKNTNSIISPNLQGKLLVIKLCEPTIPLVILYAQYRLRLSYEHTKLNG